MIDSFILEAINITGSVNLQQTNDIVVERNRSNNIADFLTRDSEITFTRRTNFGDSSDILSIRGLSAQRIMLNMDGRDISSNGVVGGNFLDFGTVPLDNIERIEVIKGGSSLEYGNSAMGGVINAYSRKPTEVPFLSIYATLGGWDNFNDFNNIRASYSQKFGPLGVSLGISRQKNEAFFRNNDFELFHVNPKIYLDTPWQGEFTLSYNYSRAKRGLIISNRNLANPTSTGNPTLAGFYTVIDPKYPLANGESFAGSSPTPSMSVLGEGAHWVKERTLVDFGYRQEIGQRGFVELIYYFNNEVRHEKNYANMEARLRFQQVIGTARDKFDSALSPQGTLVLDREVKVDTGYGYVLKSELTFGDHLIKFGGEYKSKSSGGTTVNFVDRNYNQGTQNSFTGVMNSSSASEPNTLLSFYLGDSYQINQMFRLDFGFRYDSYKDRPNSDYKYSGSGISPKFMLTVTISEHQTASIALYRNIRTPSSNQIFWFREATEPGTGNPVPALAGSVLRPEKANGLDIAYRYSFANGSFLKLSGYYYDIKDFIFMRSGLTGQNPGSARASYNGDVWISGITISGGIPILANLYTRASLSFQNNKKTRDIFDPTLTVPKIDYLPRFKGNLSATWGITDKINLDLDLTYIGERPNLIVGTGSYPLDSYLTIGGSLSYQINDHLVAELYVDNLTGSEYEETFGYPSMGFNAGVSLKWNL
ncbi:MAG: TonB-dependent receptor [Deltaproteobacteria bacterium]|nr:TonB-dependent receptor [Deltaproteobacteria bacterium]